MRKRVYIYVNGILNYPGSADGWTDRAVTWTHVHCSQAGYRAEKFEYMAGAILRRIFQQRRANKLARMISYYDPEKWHVILVAHSNGCDVALRALHLLEGRYIKEVHLIAAACDADMFRNGLAGMIRDKILGRVFVYIGGNDRPMKWARITGKVLRWIGLGYGALGAEEPEDVALIIGERRVVYEEDFGHSSWFTDENFDETMMFVTAPCV